MKNLFISLFLVAGATLFFSCKKDNADTNKSNVQLIIKSNKTVPAKASSTLSSFAGMATNLTLETFMVNISEIEFGIDEDATGLPENVLDSLVDAQELKGPFLVDLLSQKALDGLSLGKTLIPNAIYEEIEFDIEPCVNNSNPDVNNKSVYITGMLNGKPLKFWTNEEFEFENEFPDGSNFTLTGDNFKVYLDFNVGQIVSAFNLIDFSTVRDGNNNGVYEIGSNDTDGNTRLAHYIIDAMKNAVELDRDND